MCHAGRTEQSPCRASERELARDRVVFHPAVKSCASIEGIGCYNKGMFALIACLALSGLQDNPDRVSRLIEELDSDDAARRERATAGLVELGLPALPAVRKALKDSSSDEVKSRAEQIIDRCVGLEVRKIYQKRSPDSLPALKPLNCRDQVERFFPGYRFYLISLPGDELPTGAAFLTPDNSIGEYALKEDHKSGKTVLLSAIKKAGVTIKSRDDAKEFGLLWLLIAYGSEEFKVETTDHQNETRY